jgi:small-conductance mechanosensitive channel
MVDNIFKVLKKRFAIMCIVVVVLFLAIFLSHRFNTGALNRASYTITMICFFGAAIFSLCIPIIIRLVTFKNVKDNGKLSREMYFQFHNVVLISVFIGALFALYGYFALIQDILETVTVLIAMYGIYSAIPSKKTIKMELVEFNVEDYTNKNK